MLILTDSFISPTFQRFVRERLDGLDVDRRSERSDK